MTRFRIVFPNGSTISGPVVGSGGYVGTLARLEAAQRNAHRGRPTGLYEPKRGHVVVRPYYSNMSNGPDFLAELEGACITELPS